MNGYTTPDLNHSALIVIDVQNDFVLDDAPVRNIRAKVGISQNEFAFAFGISVSTLRNWERGDSTPHGPALKVGVKQLIPASEFQFDLIKMIYICPAGNSISHRGTETTTKANLSPILKESYCNAGTVTKRTAA